MFKNNRSDSVKVKWVCAMDEDEVTAYQCTVCGQIYADEDDAIACHKSSEPIAAWACGRCGSAYESREEARKCCSAV
jgi:hypothetical protein